MNKQLLAGACLAIASICPAGSFANTALTTYADFDRLTAWGTAKVENYDIAVCLSGPEYVGKKVLALKVMLNTDKDISNPQAFMTTVLDVQKDDDGVYQKIVDVCNEDAAIEILPYNDGQAAYVTHTFSTPYTITDAGIYVGYHIDVDDITGNYGAQYPIIGSDEMVPNGIFMRTSKTYKRWQTKRPEMASAMVLTIEGDFGPYEIRLDSAESLKLGANSDFSLPVTFTNFGTEEIKNFEVEYNIDGQKNSKTYNMADFDGPLTPYYGHPYTLSLPMDPVAKTGVLPLSLAITKVNGQPNAATNTLSGYDLTVYSVMPIKRPLMEEFTGTWCGYCPRGFAGMEIMNKKLGMEFVGMAYHNGDAMTVTNTYPVNVSGFPAASLDRCSSGFDAYFGYSNSGFGVDVAYENRSKVFTPFYIEASAGWNNENKDEFTVYVAVTPIENLEGDYRLSYAVIANDLTGTGSSWNQSNYYSGSSGADTEELQFFCDSGKTVSGLHFDDVVIYYPNMKGIEGSIPATAYADNKYSITRIVETSKCKSTSGVNLVQNPDNLQVIGIVTNATTGEVMNAIKININDDLSAINGVNLDAQPVRVTFYDLSGRRISNPDRGLFLRQTTYSDGSVKTEKVIL